MDKRVASIEPILPVEDAQAGDILSAYCSFYPLKGELVPGRLVNIRLGCEYICRVVEPGERFSFNEIAGPYGPAKGYEKAMSFYDGGTAPSYGGGTCQVSSTLYNVLMPLSGRGIDIVYRRSHGASGATYLPHGTDAAVGSDALDFIFRNEFDFPVRIDARSHDQGVVIYRVNPRRISGMSRFFLWAKAFNRRLERPPAPRSVGCWRCAPRFSRA